MVKKIVMTLSNGDASGVSSNYSCTSCFVKSASECLLEEIIFVRSYMNRLYYGTYLPLREKKINELINIIAECNALRTISLSNVPLNLKMQDRKSHSPTRQFTVTSSPTLQINTTEFSHYYANDGANNALQPYNEIQLYPPESASAGLNYKNTETIQNKSKVQLRRIARLQSNYQRGYKTKLIQSDPSGYTLMMGNVNKLQVESRQHKMDKEINEMSKGASTYAQTTRHPISYSSHEISRKRVRGQPSAFASSQICYSDVYVVANYTPVYSSKDLCNLKNIRDLSETSILVILSKINHSKCCARSWNSFYSFSSSFLLKPCSTNSLGSFSSMSYTDLLLPSSKAQSAEDQETQFERRQQQKSLKFVIGPYAQMQAVYNVMEQTTSQMKEKGTSQQFKKRSQGIGTVSSSQPSSSGTNDSSTGTPKRRAIKIESSVSFSIEFFNKQKSKASDIPGHDETAAQKGKTKIKGSKKKSLHRCFCTMSFPTEGRKPEECASGVCVPGECNPSECFKRIEQKYGKKKKKSASDVSSSQASQTRKTKGKEERAGKETFVKEKGSSSISKYKESVEIKPPPEKEKVSFATYLTKCCEKMRCWQQGEKDKPIALKHAVTDTNIAGKTAVTPYGSNAASQSGKKKGKAQKAAESKESVKESPAKEDKKATGKKGKKAIEKEATGIGEGDKKATAKKGKKTIEKESKAPTGAGSDAKKTKSKKGKTAGGKEVKEAKAAEGEVKKATGKKGKKATGKEATGEVAGGEVKKATGKKGKKTIGKEIKDTAGKGGETEKSTEKKGKKSIGKEVKKATEEKGKKITKKEKKKGRPLKPYECEPGVCSPKVCTPQECYERKFPPPPKEVVVLTPMNKLQNFFRKCCCRPVLGEEKKAGVSLDAATQSRRAAGPEKTPGVTVYKERGSSGPKKLKSGSKKYQQVGEAPPEYLDQPLSTTPAKGRKSEREQGPPRVDVGVPPPSPLESSKTKGRERRTDTGVPQYTDGGDYDIPAESKGYRKQRAFSGVQYYQNVDNELKTKRQGVNIGSECSCSVEFYKMIF